MPGSLPGSSSDDEMQFDMDEEDEHDEGEYGYEGEDEEEVADQAFYEDILAADEMESVAYL